MRLRQAWQQCKHQLQANLHNILNFCRNLPQSPPVRQIKHNLKALIRLLKQQWLHFSNRIIISIKTLCRQLINSLKTLISTLIDLVKTSYYHTKTWVQNRPQRTPHPRQHRRYRRLKTLAKNLIFKKPQNLAAFILILICLSFWGLFWVPTQHTFEGNFIIEELSFIYRGQPDKLFLNAIPNLKRIEIEGRQTLNLTGKFTAPNLPTLENLKINLQDSYSKLIIEPADPETIADLSLNTLRIQPQTHIRNFWYHPQQNRLSFRLNIPSKQVIPLNLSLGEIPLKITVEGYSSPQLPSDHDPFQPLQFLWTPGSTELTLSLTETAHIYLNLPELTTQSHQTWLWGNLAVEQVQFSRFAETAEMIDDLELSTIVAGNVRLKQQQLTLEPGQFLILPEPTSIQTIPRLQFYPPDQPNSLQVLIQGRTNNIKIGVAAEHPVNEIRGSFLEQFFPADVINALLTFSAVAISYLIPWLFSSK